MGEALGWKGQLYGGYKSPLSDDTIYMGAINRYYLYWWFSRHASKLNYHASKK